MPYEQDIGLSAQELLPIFPQLICPSPLDIDTNETKGSKSGMDLLTIRYDRLCPILLQAIKELLKRVESLEERMSFLYQ